MSFYIRIGCTRISSVNRTQNIRIQIHGIIFEQQRCALNNELGKSKQIINENQFHIMPSGLLYKDIWFNISPQQLVVYIELSFVIAKIYTT